MLYEFSETLNQIKPEQLDDARLTTGVVTLMASLLKDKHVGKYIVPIVPDESRTFGMDPLFKQCGIYAHTGQLYEPVDSDQLLYYREAKDGQILEEGITEAGSMASVSLDATTALMKSTEPHSVSCCGQPPQIRTQAGQGMLDPAQRV